MHGTSSTQEGNAHGAEGINRRKGPIRIQGLGPHHLAWLSIHPTRNPVWLLKMLAEGFEIHHLDGNHKNNEPKNLMLIEYLDHRRLQHGWNCQDFDPALRDERRQQIENDLLLGAIAYEARITATCWHDVDRYMPRGFKGNAAILARLRAAATGKPWPFSKGRQKSFRNNGIPKL